MRVAPQIVLDGEEREILQRWSRGRSTPARLVLRAKIILLAARGKQNNDIAVELGTERTLVGRWRSPNRRRSLGKSKTQRRLPGQIQAWKHDAAHVSKMAQATRVLLFFQEPAQL